MQIDLTVLPKGERYEKTYGQWLEVFEQIAHAAPEIIIDVSRPPASWVPLLMWLGATVYSPRVHFLDSDPLAMRCLDIDESNIVTSVFSRTQVEVLSSWRPETVDALYKCDMQWQTPRTYKCEHSTGFDITTKG